MKTILLLIPALILFSACTQKDPATAALEKKFNLPIGGGGSAPPNRKPNPPPLLTLTGDQNESLLKGQTLALPTSTVVISKTEIDGREIVTFALNGDRNVALTFSSPSNEQLAVGIYDYVRDVHQEFPRHAGLTVTVDGQSTTSVNARFQIIELERDAVGTITKFAADLQAIDGRVSNHLVGLSGAIRLNSTKPVNSPIAVPANPDNNNTHPSTITLTSGRNSSGVSEAQGDFAVNADVAKNHETLSFLFAANYPNLGDGTFTYAANAEPHAMLNIDLGQCAGTIKNLNVLELERDADKNITKFAANFDLVCHSGGAVQKGYFRYHSDLAF